MDPEKVTFCVVPGRPLLAILANVVRLALDALESEAPHVGCAAAIASPILVNHGRAALGGTAVDVGTNLDGLIWPGLRPGEFLTAAVLYISPGIDIVATPHNITSHKFVHQPTTVRTVAAIFGLPILVLCFVLHGALDANAFL